MSGGGIAMDILFPVLVILFLILVNGLFVAAEFALAGAPRAAIEQRALKGHPVACLVKKILSDPRQQDRYIATAQLGITIASLGLGMYGEHVIADWIYHFLQSLGAAGWYAAHTLASILAVTILTYFHIVLGEMVPKSMALVSAADTALYTTPVLRVFQYALYPLVIGLNATGNWCLKLMGIKRELSAAYYLTPTELEFLVKESHEGGLLQAEAGRVLRDLFEFGELTAGEVMVPRVRVTGLPRDATPERIMALVRSTRHSRYPVYDGDLDHIAGIVHFTDLFCILRTGATISSGRQALSAWTGLARNWALCWSMKRLIPSAGLF